MPSKTFQAKLTLEGTAEQIEHALLALVRNIQLHTYHYAKLRLDATGYEDILIDSELKEI